MKPAAHLSPLTDAATDVADRNAEASVRGPVRIALIGLGSIGEVHARNLREGGVAQAELAAVIHPEAARRAAFAPGVRGFASLEEMIAAGAADAVIVATPQASHVSLGAQALAAGLHVLMEKPLAIHHAAAHELVGIRLQPGQQFSLMLNQRVDPAYRTLRRAIQDGVLGRLQRVLWVATDWFRSQRYYDDRPARGTWRDEGGGVLINQALHQLDLYRWIFGRPETVTGHCGFGRHHAIEAEDEATAYFRHGDGMHATFIASTGEAPGINRVEVVGELGRLTLQDGRVTLWKNARSSAEVIRQSTTWFDRPACEESVLPLVDAPERARHHGGQHAEILENFTRAILGEEVLIAPAGHGLWALELGNAIQLSAWNGASVPLPLDDAAYARAWVRAVEAGRAV
jgi:predicted dehydrogenase